MSVPMVVGCPRKTESCYKGRYLHDFLVVVSPHELNTTEVHQRYGMSYN